MSRRTSEANVAIKHAWEREKQFVLEGKGTRNWTPKQQRDILTKGKAFDENVQAFQGHHMKCVSGYPQYQGRAENIQFLSSKEHFEAHSNDYTNKTNGYYNPKTGQTKDFGRRLYEPCKARNLTNSIDKKDFAIAMVKERAIAAKEADASGGNDKTILRENAVSKLKSVSQKQTSVESKMNPNPVKTREALRDIQQHHAKQISKGKNYD